MSDNPVTQEECIKRNMDAVVKVNDRIDQIEGRVSRLEEQVGGDMGIVKTLQSMGAALQELRDALNKQSWLLPLATAVVTTVAVTLISKLL